ncbi:MAG TPA: hypothetical protein VGG72_15450 [Bryobacteraceae bacterium]
MVFSGVGFAGSYTVSVIPEPTTIPIPSPDGFATAGVGMSGINNAGQVAGGDDSAFVASPSGVQHIPLPAGTIVPISNPITGQPFSISWAVAINSSGQVAGNFLMQMGALVGSFGSEAFIGTPSGSTAIPCGGAHPSGGAGAINDLGQVAGTCNGSLFIGTPSGTTVIPTPSGWANAYLDAMNNSGQVAGYVSNAAQTVTQALIGSVSGTTLIPLPSGWSSSSGFAINNLGQVAGSGTNGGGAEQAFIGTAAGVTAIIPIPPGATWAAAYLGSLNGSGVVVGSSDAGGWIWDATNGTRLLNSMVPSGWNITSAISISQNGLILAEGTLTGGFPQFVELTPALPPTTPAPGTGLLALAGLLFVFGWCGRSRMVNRREPVC